MDLFICGSHQSAGVTSREVWVTTRKNGPNLVVHRCPCLTYQNQSSSLKVFFPFIMKLWTFGYWPNVSWSRHSSVTFFWWYVVIYCDILWYIMIYCDILWYIVTYCTQLYTDVMFFLVAEICSSNPVFHSLFGRFFFRWYSEFRVGYIMFYPLVNRYRPWKSPIFNGN